MFVKAATGADQGDALCAAFARAMGALGLGRKQPLAVACSGGGDSTALLALAMCYAQGAPVRALIVDHGLRAESAAEARQAARMARSLGACARILCWTSPGPGQARARNARYGLLAQACREAGLDHVLLAHTRDDQEETFALRLARGSSARGLACMSARAPLPLWPQGRGLWLARPLLGFARQDLRCWLRAQGLRWVEDPSNRDRRYGRVRMRQHLACLRRHGLAPGRIAATVRNLAALEQQRRRHATALLDQAVRWHGAGYAVLDLADIEDVLSGKAESIARVLDAVLAGVSGKGAPSLSHARARHLVQQLKPGVRCTRSLAGCRLHSNGAQVLISRDPGAVLGRGRKASAGMVAVAAGDHVVCDGRFALPAAQAVHLKALGDAAACLPQSQYQALGALPAAVRRTVPVMEHAAGGLVSPVLGGAGTVQFLGREIARRLLAPFSHGCT